MDYEEKVRSKLVKLRKERGISQSEISNITGLKQGNVSKYEKGERMLSINNLGKLAEFYEVSTDELMEINSNKKNWDI